MKYSRGDTLRSYLVSCIDYALAYMHYRISYPLFPFESQLGTACLCLGTTPHGKYAVLFGCFGPGVWISTLKQCTIWVTKNWSLPCGSRCFKNPRFNPTLPCMRPHSMSLPAALEATKIFIFGVVKGKQNITVV